jgi:hypothetical protein
MGGRIRGPNSSSSSGIQPTRVTVTAPVLDGLTRMLYTGCDGLELGLQQMQRVHRPAPRIRTVELSPAESKFHRSVPLLRGSDSLKSEVSNTYPFFPWRALRVGASLQKSNSVLMRDCVGTADCSAARRPPLPRCVALRALLK